MALRRVTATKRDIGLTKIEAAEFHNSILMSNLGLFFNWPEYVCLVRFHAPLPIVWGAQNQRF